MNRLVKCPTLVICLIPTASITVECFFRDVCTWQIIFISPRINCGNLTLRWSWKHLHFEKTNKKKNLKYGHINIYNIDTLRRCFFPFRRIDTEVDSFASNHGEKNNSTSFDSSVRIMIYARHAVQWKHLQVTIAINGSLRNIALM